MSDLEGQCLCGGVRVRLPRPTHDVGACHCARCRRWGSGPWLSFQVPQAVVSGESLRVFRSSAFAERGFWRESNRVQNSIEMRHVFADRISKTVEVLFVRHIKLHHRRFNRQAAGNALGDVGSTTE